MKSLKRPLAILLAAIMLVSVLAIAPVTASATTVTYTVAKWVKGENREGTALYKFPDLFENIIFTRMAPGLDPSWEHVEKNNSWQDNKTENLSLSTKGNTDTFQLQYWHNDNGTMLGTWYDYGNVNDGIYLDAADRNDNSFAHTDVDWYAYTWEDFTLEYHAANTLTDNGKHNVECYTNGSRYFLHRNDTYEVVEKNEVFFEYVSASGVGINPKEEITLDSENDPMYGVGGMTSARSLETVGVQNGVREETGFRFLTVVKSDILKIADDYGYIIVKPENVDKDTAMSKAGQLVASSIDPSAIYSCKGTDNNFSGNYGSSNLGETDYKYVSCFIKNISSGQAVVCRFYVKIDGINYFYAQYSPDNSTWYDGCAYALS